MAFFVAFVLAAFSATLYYAGQGGQLSFVCSYTLDLCQHPVWPLVVACGFGAFGMLFRVHSI